MACADAPRDRETDRKHRDTGERLRARDPRTSTPAPHHPYNGPRLSIFRRASIHVEAPPLALTGVRRVAKPKILLVDDEPENLKSMARVLRTTYEALTATSGELGLETLAQNPDISIIVSDMRMPEMNGTAFLARARVVAPDAVRLLLTGQADMEDAVGAVNQGNIFRFLRKPCPPELLWAALADASTQYRLVIAEREILEQTLHGSVKALADTLALASPTIFGMATRVKRVVTALSEKVPGTEKWQLEVAAMLCHLGAMTVPAGVFERRAKGEVLPPNEREMLGRVPMLTEQLLQAIPRLEGVREIIQRGFDGTEMFAPTVLREVGPNAPSKGAHVLRIAIDFEELESQGLKAKAAIDRMRAREDRYDAAVLDALADIYLDNVTTVVELPITRLLEGMIVATDLFTKTGLLLVARGNEVTPTLARRLENFASSIEQSTVFVVADRDQTPIRRVAA